MVLLCKYVPELTGHKFNLSSNTSFTLRNMPINLCKLRKEPKRIRLRIDETSKLHVSLIVNILKVSFHTVCESYLSIYNCFAIFHKMRSNLDSGCILCKSVLIMLWPGSAGRR